MILENLYLIVAITEKSNAIGKDNNLLYFLKEDMNFFKEKTCGNSIICGRKTFEGFKIKPLPKRKNIVLTNSDFSFLAKVNVSQIYQNQIPINIK